MLAHVSNRRSFVRIHATILAISNSIFIIAIGFFCVAIAVELSRAQQFGAQILFWAGLSGIISPTAAIIISKTASDSTRIAFLLLTGLLLYLVKVIEYPLYFTFFDEFLHWKTARDIIATHHIFHFNSLLPVSPLYPGMEIVSNAISSLTGLSTFSTAIILIGLSRIIMVLSIYHLFADIMGSTRAASIGTLFYMLNPNFVFFDSQYGYESFAIPLAIFSIWLITRALHLHKRERLLASTLIIATLLAIGVTHHVTSFMLLALLALWTLIVFWQTKKLFRSTQSPIWYLLFLLVFIVFWLRFVANMVIGYLAPYAIGSIQEIIRIIMRENTARHLFVDSTGYVAPAWERMTATGSVGLIILSLPFGYYAFVKWHRAAILPMVLGLASLAYPASLALRFTQAGADVAGRLSGFIFLALGYIFALAVTEFSWNELRQDIFRRFHRYIVPEMTIRNPILLRGITALIVLFFAGGIIAGGGPDWARMPGPYLVSADMRSIDALGITTSTWMADYLPPHQRVAADRINGILAATYGQQHTISYLGDGIDVAPLYLAPALTPDLLNLLTQARIQYFMVDTRLSTQLPHVGVYFEVDNVDAVYTTPIALDNLLKFNQLSFLNHIYDNGTINIYSVGAFVK